MKNLKFTPFSALLLIASIGSLQAATPPTKITSAQVITVTGSYVLANDITGAIEIQASDVTLNLNGHTITALASGIVIDQFDIGGLTLVNVRVSNGRIIAAPAGGIGVQLAGSSCLITGLNITVGQGTGFVGEGFLIEHGQFNRIHSCVITGQQAALAFDLFLTSHNVIQNNTLVGTFVDTIEEQDQVVGANTVTVAGDNTFNGNQFASPTP